MRHRGECLCPDLDISLVASLVADTTWGDVINGVPKFSFYSNMGRFGDAANAVKEAIRLEPDHAEAHSYLGIVYTNMSLYAEGIQEFKTAIRLDPHDSGARFGLGKVCSSLGERASAPEEYKMLRQLNAELAEKLFDLIYK